MMAPREVTRSSSESSYGSYEYCSSDADEDYKPGIRIMQAEDLMLEMQRRITDVTEVLGVSMAAAGVLLRQYNFSKDTLLEEYTQAPEEILHKAGVFHRCGNTKPPPASRHCPICYDDECNKVIAMPCGHQFCVECCYSFCANAVNEGPSAILTTCPQHMCPEIVTEEEMSRALGATDPLLQKFLTYQLRSFVEVSESARWCPGKGCDRIVCAYSVSAMEAEGNSVCCDACLTCFCLVCGEEPHSPSSCKDLAKWNEKCGDESETANWVLSNTKPCPECQRRIEKNQGCNHMTCSACKHEFCWICMGNWNEHRSNYECNRFRGGGDVDGGNSSDVAKAKQSLDRYLHFYQRFHAHQQAQSFAEKQLEDIQSRMFKLHGLSADVQFLKTANKQLVECRRVLKYTYVFAFYMDDPSPQVAMLRERFEHHQEMLERFAEHLSELSEKPLQEMDRLDVVNQTRAVGQFMKNILKYVEEGVEDV